MSFLRRNRLIALLGRNPDFALYSAGNVVSLVGMWMQRVAVGWLTWQLTKSGFWLGLIAAADFFPVLIIGPFAGAAADRWDRMRVVMTSQAVALLQAAGLALLTVTGHIDEWILLALTTFQGCVVAFNQPARLALVPSLVPQTDLTGAVAFNSVVFNLARFVGPIFAGLMIVWWGIASAFAANALSYVAFLVALARIRNVPPMSKPAAGRSFSADLREGLHYTATHPAIAALLILLTALGVGGRPLNELLPGFADELYRSGAAGLSVLVSAIGGGAIVGGLWLGHRGDPSGLTAIALGGAVGSAVSAVLAISTENLWLAVPAVTVFGFCMSTSGVAIQTLIQITADASMRGRVMGLYGLIFRGAPSIGALLAGLASASLGLRWPVVLGAILVVLVCLWTWRRRARIAAALVR